MDHSEAIRTMASEKYLLDELTDTERDAFEEHFFDCRECATDVKAGSIFLEQSKVELGRPGADRRAKTGPAGWWAWLTPNFAVPAVAVLLLGVLGFGYQDFALRRQANQLQLLPATVTLNLSTLGDDGAAKIVHPGEDLLLNVIVPPGASYETYEIELHQPSGGVKSLPVLRAAAEDTWSVKVPAANLQSGAFKLIVQGVASSGQTVEVGRSSFQLQIQK